ncbi:MAG: photosynthetic reaction center subunit H [Rhodovarius sp.]|nr:photosynthetic reaction center subunit H [Rhodovarius sp.]
MSSLFSGNIAGNFDLTLILLYIFWVFFFGLVFWLHREGKREGYPLISERDGRVIGQGWPAMPPPKTFILRDGRTVQAPRPETQPDLSVRPMRFNGEPIEPLGDPMQLGLGPAAYPMRADKPHLAAEDNEPSIQPLRVAAAKGFYLAKEDPDPRGMTVLDADGEAVGTVVDVWVDRSEYIARYAEAELPSGKRVLIPFPLMRIDERAKAVRVKTLLKKHFEAAPTTAHPDMITLREEDRISAYFASGQLYAKPERAEPWL